MSLLTTQEIIEGLEKLEDWELSDNKIMRLFNFADFKGAIEFVNKVANKAEAANHYPEMDILYNKVRLTLWTRSESGLTEKDVKLAAEINSLQ